MNKVNTNPIYTLTGRITNPEGQPLQSLTVRAYVQSPKTLDILVEQKTETDADGEYTLQFTDNDIRTKYIVRFG